jgi:O-Antigen ligase
MNAALADSVALERRHAHAAPIVPGRLRGRPLGRLPGRATDRPAEAARLVLCASAVVALLLAWSARGGGYATLSWVPATIGLIVLIGWSRLAFGPGRSRGRYGCFALIALALYVAWSFASIAWAVDKGAAVTGSERVLLYLLLFALFSSLEWTRKRLELALVVYMLGVGGVAMWILAELAVRPAPQLLQLGTLVAGLGYHNALAALGTIGAGGSILLGCSRRRSAGTRAALTGGATACLVISLLAESRGWLLTLPVIALMLLAIVPGRGRVAAWGLIPLGAAAATLPWVLHGWALADAGRPAASVSHADVLSSRAGLLAALAAALVAWLLARIQRSFGLAPHVREAARRGSRLTVTLMAELAAGGAAILIGSGAVARAWHQFVTDAPLRAGVSRFAELGSGRFDFWRVALQSFISHPLGGLGQDNFAQAYVASRHTGEEPLWVHSLELRLLAHTGAVGFVLFGAFLVCALVALARAAGQGNRTVRAAVAVAIVPLAVWTVQGSVDWFWEFPALSGAALAFLGAAVALEPGRGIARASSGAAARRVGALLTVALTTAALALLVSTYIGERAVQQARTLEATNPTQALRNVRLAASAEPLSSAPQALAAAIELRAGNRGEAMRYASDGLSRNGGDWVLWLEQGMAARAAGDPALERAALHRATVLDPREPAIVLAERDARSAHPLTIAEAASIFSARANGRVAP